MASVVVDYTASYPQYVAKSFVDQYYNVLLYKPAYAYKYYVDSSVVSWPGSDGKSVVTVTTMEKIQELMMSQDYHGCQALVETIDGQYSQSGGITVVVTGTWRGQDETARGFSQTFILERNGKKPFYWNQTCPRHCSGDWHLGSYYIVNDVFRFLDHHEPPAAADVVSKAASQQQEVVNKAETLPEKISYATIAEKKAAGAAANSWADQVAADNNSGSSSSSSSSLSSSLQDDDVVLVNSKSVALNNKLEEERDRESRTIHVGNLPLGVSADELRDVVKKSFGRITKGGVRVRSNNYYGYCWAFVEFESAASASYAIRMGKIFFGQHEAYVTQKRRSPTGDARPVAQMNRGGPVVV